MRGKYWIWNHESIHFAGVCWPGRNSCRAKQGRERHSVRRKLFNRKEHKGHKDRDWNQEIREIICRQDAQNLTAENRTPNRQETRTGDPDKEPEARSQRAKAA
ncbi:MAG: hypothetical protein WAO02_16385 [Verrucomicrobiia bacterium]